MPVSAPIAATRSGELHVQYAATSMAVEAILSGPVRAGEVVASTRDMVAVLVPDVDPGLICLTSRSAARLPCAMVLSGPVPSTPVGASATVGGGRVHLPGVSVGTARWWPVRLPLVTDAAAAIDRSTRCPTPDLDHAVLDAAAALACALHSRALRLDETVRALLGLGPGLTPQGDDVLAGALIALRTARAPGAARLTAEITAAAPFERTTAVSAGLLGYAGHGRCVPELSAFLDALGTPGVSMHDALHALLAVGHTSGAGLYAGVLCALAGPAPLARDRRRR